MERNYPWEKNKNLTNRCSGSTTWGMDIVDLEARKKQPVKCEFVLIYSTSPAVAPATGIQSRDEIKRNLLYFLCISETIICFIIFDLKLIHYPQWNYTWAKVNLKNDSFRLNTLSWFYFISVHIILAKSRQQGKTHRWKR